MKNNRIWIIFFVLFLGILSLGFYTLQFLLFKDIKNTMFYMLQDLAFVPIQIIIVTLILQNILEKQQKKMRIEKLNMVIGAFFSEAGTYLLTFLSDYDPELEDIKKKLIISREWTKNDFAEVQKTIREFKFSVNIHSINLYEFKKYLHSKREFALALIENPSLLEHQSFTELLMAFFHLIEELENRKNIENLQDADLEHIKNDIKRVYSILVNEWLSYLRHLKFNYPYLFSLALRTNPFDEKASVEISE